MTEFTLIPVTPEAPAGISCRYAVADPDQTERLTILVVAFEGEYPDGSLGNRHGAYMAASTMHGLHSFRPECVVLDLRGLTYRWGSALLRVFQDVSQFMDAGNAPGEAPFPVLVVTSESSRAGFLSLVTPSGGEPPEGHFDDLDAALRFGVRKANEWLAS